MIALILKEFFMAELPTGDLVVFGFCELLAIGFACEFAVKFLNGDVVPACIAFLITLALFITGIKWPAIKARMGVPLRAKIDRLTSNPRFQVSTLLIIVGCFVGLGLQHVQQIRADVDEYAMPRMLSGGQVAAIKAVVSLYDLRAHDPQAIVNVVASVTDAEAEDYADEIMRALREGGWDAHPGTVDPWSATNKKLYGASFDNDLVALDAGIEIAVSDTGQPRNDPNIQHQTPDEVLEKAFDAAGISYGHRNGRSTDGYVLTVVVARRPFRTPVKPSLRRKFFQWLVRLLNQ